MPSGASLPNDNFKDTAIPAYSAELAPAELQSSHSLGTDVSAVPSPPRTPPRGPPAVITQATPQRASSHDSEYTYRIVDDVRSAVNVELSAAWVEERDSLPFQTHLQAITDQEYPELDGEVHRWLQGYSGYDNEKQCWKHIPADAAKEEVLYDPIVTIMQDILKRFGNETQKEGEEIIQERKVVKTHRAPMRHNAADAFKDPLKSEPDVSIFGTGPAATKEKTLDDLLSSYAIASSLWEIKLRETFEETEKGQVGVYGREVFIQQPNRRFVYVPLMTGKVIRILRFDRAGCYYSQRINYHTNAVFFVKLVILLSSFNEELLGFDTSIYWKDGQRFMKMTPAEELVFKLEDQPVFSRRTIRSRGTVCWSAEYEGQKFIVKDYWRADGRARESSFLKELTGVKGVGQMFTFADDRESIRAGRGFTKADDIMVSDRQAQHVLDRWLTRLVLPKYGETLEKARSARQLLCALRDIVAGHFESAVDRGILHRDISFGNLLLSPYESCGVVIDWDLAKKMDDLIAGHTTDGDSRTGTRAYQSVKVLKASPKLGHHDHLDDLESIYYVLYSILYGYDTRGDPLDSLFSSSNLTLWNDHKQTPEALSKVKIASIVLSTSETLTRYVDKDDVLVDFMEDMRQFFKLRIEGVEQALRARRPEPLPPYSPTKARADYSAVLALIEDTIPKLPEVAVAPPPSPSGSISSTKRGRGDEDDADLRTPARKKATASRHRSNSESEASTRPRRSSAAPPNYKDLSDSDVEDD
ncbi:hypothetical protein B0H11DRAFT_1846362 [Mycena galericulata]|nr:hypothetical protein B0H11DRAFT_1846362 [Mycena galericulata]